MTWISRLIARRVGFRFVGNGLDRLFAGLLCGAFAVMNFCGSTESLGQTPLECQDDLNDGEPDDSCEICKVDCDLQLQPAPITITHLNTPDEPWSDTWTGTLYPASSQGIVAVGSFQSVAWTTAPGGPSVTVVYICKEGAVRGNWRVVIDESIYAGRAGFFGGNFNGGCDSVGTENLTCAVGAAQIQYSVSFEPLTDSNGERISGC